MLTIILGLLIAGLILFIFSRVEAEYDTISIFVMIIFLVVFASIVVGLFCPISGYTNWEPTDRKDLVTLSNSTVGGSEGFIYISVSSSNVYTYRYEIDSEFGTDTSSEFVTDTIDGKYVVEVEDESIDTAYLQKFTRKAKISIWTFGLLSKETKYVFYVPPGSISKDVNLN